ncbi:MAG: MBL fold metallo-hydrolase [Proteobacteria bacterium]|nr:MBL fold metallo-hydrolase [Pseudomonadota bacterium]
MRQIKIGHMDNFAYLLADDFQRIGTVVDPGWPGDGVARLMQQAEEDGVDIKYIVLTHSHNDHTAGVTELVAKTGAEIVIHEEELPPAAKKGFDYDITVKGNDLLNLGGLELRIIHTPGHSPGSICLYSGGKLFTGDTLFVGGCGRADLSGSDPQQLYDSLFNKLLALPDETEVYPGHDYGDTPSSTIGAERQENRFLKTRSTEDFVSLRMAV